MDLLVIDDAAQSKPTRKGMGALTAAGALHVPDPSVASLERNLDDLCRDYGFPDGEEFKWSPEPGLWMRTNLVSRRRTDFYCAALALAAEASVTAIVAIEDIDHSPANTALTHEFDVVVLLLERANNHLEALRRDALIIADRPSGDRAAEYKFLDRCCRQLKEGTAYVRFDRLSLVTTTASRQARLLQLTDLVVSSTLALVAGEKYHAPPVFEAVRPLLREKGGRVGAVGLKLHPDFRYLNLYHWLLGDTHSWKHNVGHEMPLPDYPYATSPDTP